MDVREKLVELLSEIIDGGFKWHNYLYESGEQLNNDEIASYLIATGVTVQAWIPVTERLPENIANRVLVVCERSNGVFYAHYEKPFWINLETDKPFISTVTHWMPLPEPPKGE